MKATHPLLGLLLGLARGLIHAIQQQVDDQTGVDVLFLRVLDQERLEPGQTADVHLARHEQQKDNQPCGGERKR
jgi:hypothetical protein